jgi:hypothetical protein
VAHSAPGLSVSMWLVMVGLASSHPLAPSRIVLEQVGEGDWQVEQRMPRAALGVLEVRLPCEGPKPTVELDAGLATLQQSVHCEVLDGLEVVGIEESGSPLLVEVRAEGRVGRTLLSRDGPAPLPAARGRWEEARRYLWLGAVHVLSGVDHVLVVLALAMGAGRRMLRAVTGFTAGHSLTLVACALGWLVVPVGIAEALIALSLIGLGEQVRRGQPAGWRVAALIGLLHGLGFGRGLAEAGLPMEATGRALVSFNLGVELGQIAVIVVAVALWRVVQGRAALSLGLGAVGVYALLRALLG